MVPTWEQVAVAHAKCSTRKEASRKLLAEKAEWLDVGMQLGGVDQVGARMAAGELE